MTKLLILLLAFSISCGQSGLQGDGNSLFLGNGKTEIPDEFLDQICGGRSPEFQRKFKISASAGGGRLSGSLEEGQYSGQTLRRFAGQKGSDGILYMEEKGEDQFNVVISVCRRPPGNPSDFYIEAFGLSIKTADCPPYADINSATVRFTREGTDYYGRPRTIQDAFRFSAIQCR